MPQIAGEPHIYRLLQSPFLCVGDFFPSLAVSLSLVVVLQAFLVECFPAGSESLCATLSAFHRSEGFFIY